MAGKSISGESGPYHSFLPQEYTYILFPSCVLGEMFSRRPILTGTSDLDQLEKIWQLCGTPNQHTWPNFDALPGCEGVKRFSTNHPRRIKTAYERLGVDYMSRRRC